MASSNPVTSCSSFNQNNACPMAAGSFFNGFKTSPSSTGTVFCMRHFLFGRVNTINKASCDKPSTVGFSMCVLFLTRMTLGSSAFSMALARLVLAFTPPLAAAMNRANMRDAKATASQNRPSKSPSSCHVGLTLRRFDSG